MMKPMTPPSFEVDQVLFGYQRGHRLLASSRPIPPAVEDRLLPITDAGFRDSIATLSGGEPVEELGAYFLYRSWPATEVKRPGAVWTHGLLISFADLGRIEDLTSLLTLLRDPGASEEGSFRNATSLPKSVRSKSLARSKQAERELLSALYGMPDDQVIWPGKDPDHLLGSVMAIWSQQWPRLRRSFRFKSIAESAPRFLSSIDLILSADPDLSVGSKDVDQHEWLDCALADLASTKGSLRSFLWRFGPEAEAGRGAYRALVRLYQATLGPESVGSLRARRDILAAEFPRSSEMPTLKRALLGPAEDPAAELVRLQVLLASGGDGFDSENMEIGDRAARLWKGDRPAAFDLFLAVSQKKVVGARGAYAAASVPLLRAADVARLAAERPSLFERVIGEREEFLSTRAFWKALPEEGEQPALQALDREVTGSTEQRGVLGALAAEGRDKIIAALHPDWEEAAAAGFGLLARRERLGREILERWVPIFSSTEDDVVEWIGAVDGEPAALLGALASFVDPTRAARATPAKLWLPLTRLNTADLVDVDPLEVTTFLLALGLLSNGGPARKLTGSSIAPVDRALGEGGLSPRARHALERVLSPQRKDRNRQEELRRAFVDKVIAEEWKKNEVLSAVAENPSLAERVASLLDQRQKKKGLVRKIWDAVTP
jgi:hypothetical protein